MLKIKYFIFPRLNAWNHNIYKWQRVVGPASIKCPYVYFRNIPVYAVESEMLGIKRWNCTIVGEGISLSRRDHNLDKDIIGGRKGSRWLQENLENWWKLFVSDERQSTFEWVSDVWQEQSMPSLPATDTWQAAAGMLVIVKLTVSIIVIIQTSCCRTFDESAI